MEEEKEEEEELVKRERFDEVGEVDRSSTL